LKKVGHMTYFQIDNFLILHALGYLKPVTVFECEVNWVNSSLSMMWRCFKNATQTPKAVKSLIKMMCNK
jgi:hypothetical protein